jgi:hypothetical protein
MGLIKTMIAPKRRFKMILYKLTDQNEATYNGKMKWGKNITNKLPHKENPQLCSQDVIHAYKNKNLAFLLNPIHGNYTNPLLWEAKGNIIIKDYGKIGCFELTTTKTIAIPNWINSKAESKVRIQFAVLCAEIVLKYFTEKFPEDERPKKAIKAAKKYLKNPCNAAAAYAANAAAAYAANADAANADAAYADAAYAAAAAAAYTADAAAYAADAAARAATINIDFGKLADLAVKLILEK